MELLEFLFAVIAILTIIIYVIPYLFRRLLAMLFHNLVNKAEQQHQNYRRNYDSNNSADKVKVDYIPQTPKGKIPDSEGDFVDYEEIK